VNNPATEWHGPERRPMINRPIEIQWCGASRNAGVIEMARFDFDAEDTLDGWYSLDGNKLHPGFRWRYVTP